MAFFAPHRGYAVGSEPGCQVLEFKQMVKALHQAGIEVILDVVFNHTCEGNELGPVLSFQRPGESRLLPHRQRRQPLQQLLGLRQHDQRKPSDRSRDDLPLPAALGAQLSRGRIPLRSGIDSQSQPSGAPGAESAPGGNDRRGSHAGRHEDHCRSLGCRRRLSGRFLLGPFAVGGMERPLPRRRASLLARRCRNARCHGHAAVRVRATCTCAPADLRRAVSTSSRRTTVLRSTTWSPTRTSTTRPMAKEIATATTTTCSDNYGVEGPTRRRAIRRLAGTADQEHAGHAAC